MSHPEILAVDVGFKPFAKMFKALVARAHRPIFFCDSFDKHSSV